MKKQVSVTLYKAIIIYPTLSYQMKMKQILSVYGDNDIYGTSSSTERCSTPIY